MNNLIPITLDELPDTLTTVFNYSQEAAINVTEQVKQQHDHENEWEYTLIFHSSTGNHDLTITSYHEIPEYLANKVVVYHVLRD